MKDGSWSSLQEALCVLPCWDQLAQKTVDNGWAGVLMFGCIRDIEGIGRMPLGVLTLASNPRQNIKKGAGEADPMVEVAGVSVRPNEW